MQNQTQYSITNKARRSLIQGSFVKLMFSNMFVLIATCACGFIDNLFVGQILGTKALAAVGFLSPFTMAMGLVFVLVLGAQVLSGKLIGQGDGESVKNLFNSSFLTITVIYTLIAVLSFMLRSPLANLLGSSGEIHTLLCDYISGYAFGVLPQALVALFMSLASFNNEIKKTYISTAVMLLGNVVGDFFLAPKLGLFGIGLASTISSFASMFVLLPGFLSKRKVFCLTFNYKFSFKLIWQAIVLGWPSLMFTIGMVVKNYLFNYALNNYSGGNGVAAANIMNTVCAVVGAIPGGVGASFATLSALYLGEEDRQSYLDLAKITLKIGIIASLAAIVVLSALSYPMSYVFFPSDEEGRAIVFTMFILAFTFLLPNVIYNVFLKSYITQGRMTLPNILSFVEVSGVGLFVLIFVPIFGLNAAWLSNLFIDCILIVVVLITVIVWRKKFDLSLAAVLKLPDDFGVQQEDLLEYSLDNIQEVSLRTEDIISFCKSKGLSEKTAYHVALCVEEMTVNVLQYGFDGKKKYSVDVRIVSKNGMTVRVRDNCREFDPRQRLEVFSPKEPEKNIGIRIVARKCIFMDYYNNAGTNTVIMKF